MEAAGMLPDKAGIEAGRRHGRPPPDSWGVSAGGSPEPCSQQRLLPAGRCCAAGRRRCPLRRPLRAALLHQDQADRSPRECPGPENKPVEGSGGWIQAATAAALGKGWAGDARGEGAALAPCSLAGGAGVQRLARAWPPSLARLQVIVCGLWAFSIVLNWAGKAVLC